MSSDSDTPPPYRTRSDANIQVPIAAQWFDEWRKETKADFKALTDEVNNLESRLQEARFANLKHDDQIGLLAKSHAETDRAVLVLATRVSTVEKAEQRRADADESDEKSLIGKVKETIVLTAVGGLVLGAGAFVWFLFAMYMQAQHAITLPVPAPLEHP